ncbi:TetR/AcrR family transcriptional regulator [Azorhizophilus paspali]|uniref:TetR/AcrR family transcriptional regulator n=1 Tax=Azorhizophilus paspali TaxID=69963 RepID=A0ABV6SGH8_AZOPA
MSKRQEIVDTATRLFESNGFHAVGVDTIIAESKVAKMTMYRHFHKKNQLIVEVLNNREAYCAQSLAEYVNQHSSPIARIKSVFEWHENWFRNATFSGCMFAHAASEFNDDEDGIKSTAATQKARLKSYIEELLKHIVSPTEADRLSRLFIMLLDGATLTAQVMNQPEAAMEAWGAAKVLLRESIDFE